MFDLKALLDAHDGQQLQLMHEHINPAYVRAIKLIGFDVLYARGQGAYLWDNAGQRYIDCLGGYGVFIVGRNHPVVRETLKQAMDLDLPNLVKMGAYKLSGILAKQLLAIAPGGPANLGRVFFTNSGAEAVETALKFARIATGRARIVYCGHGFHGLTLGALSVNGNQEFRAGFGPLMGPATEIPFDDLPALERELSKKDVAGFIVEPIQGKGVHVPADGYLRGVQELCRKTGTIFIVDEVQTGFGRTGKMFACEHWGIEPDIMAVAKGLSGGYVPVGAALSKSWIHEKCFSSMQRCVVHSTTFGQNDMSMAAGLATLHVLKEEKIIENSAAMGELLKQKLAAMVGKYELVKEVRGKGLMLALEFGQPSLLRSPGLYSGWKLLHAIDKSLFPQAILIPLLKEHHILAQVAGHHMDVIKLLPPLVLTIQDVDDIAKAFEAVTAACHKFPGPAWEAGKNVGMTVIKYRKTGVDKPVPVG